MKFSHYIEAPNFNCDATRPWLFLAGGITNTPNWQAEAKNLLFGESPGGTLFNPRRALFDVTNPDAAEEQITWEYAALSMADAILFWFPKEQVQPIALFELGRWSGVSADKPIFVGVQPEYPRKYDIEIQMKLVRPSMPIFKTLGALCTYVKAV